MASRVIVLACLYATDLSFQICLKHISRISHYPAHNLNSHTCKQFDCPRPDASGNHDICSLFIDEFRNHPGNMVMIIGVCYAVGLDYFFALNIYNQIVRATAEMLADLATQSLVVITR